MRLQKFYIIFVSLIALIVIGVFVARDSVSLAPLPLEALAPNVSAFSEFDRAKILEISQEQSDQIGQINRIIQTVQVRFTTGALADSEKELTYEISDSRQKLKVGDTVVIAETSNPDIEGGEEFYIVDQYRLPALGVFALIFVILAIIFGKWRGVTALVGLAFSLCVLLYFLAPQILSGQSPAVMAFYAALVIAVVSIFIAHGFNRRTTLSVVSTVIILCFVQGLAYASVVIFRLFGNGSEESLLLQSTSFGSLDLQGLLLAGIVIGTLGILDDITTAQTAAVEELYLANPNFSRKELYSRAMSIGREHIASLINTLVLAYAGAFFPLFLIIILNFNQPLWTVINSEFISEEIVRALVGSTALVLAVPFTSLLATWYFTRIKKQSL